MKTRWLLLFVAILVMSINSFGQDACRKARLVIDKVNKLHIKPRAVNDTLSADIYSQFFHTLDPYSQFFISKDTGALVRFRNKLDDGNEPICSFLNEATTLFRRKTQWYRDFADSVLSKPMDLVSQDFLSPVFSTQDESIVKTNAELKLRALRLLKYEVLSSMYRRYSIDPTKSLTELEQTARQRVKKNVLVKIEALLKDQKKLSKEVDNSFLKAIPAVFDPHSTFFTKEEEASWSENLSPSALSFGIKLEESPMGQVFVSNVVPGGPAWNSNQVNKGDMLVGMRMKGSGEYIDLADLSQDVVQGYLEKQDETSAEITIRKTSGEVRTVKLLKDKIENEENIVSGFVLKGKSSKRSIGYISLPGFFTDDVHPELKGCAVAVAREIIKLKGESIEGLILDLRFNGGGSMAEAVELAGLFINTGPIMVMEERGQQPITLKDSNPGFVYGGPLVIMVNGGSASASEMLAAGLQDHKRAIIAGSKTYGKGTGQQIFPLNDSNTDDGFLKVTGLRVYRINGKSHQLTGVIPDFSIPDFSSLIYNREEDLPHAMKVAPINKKTYYTPWPASPEESLIKATETSRDPDRFSGFNNMKDVLTSNVPLERKAFFDYMRMLEISSLALTKGIEKSKEEYTVTNSQYDKSMLQVDAYHKEINDDILGQVRASVAIHEAYRLLDIIITKNK